MKCQARASPPGTGTVGIGSGLVAHAAANRTGPSGTPRDYHGQMLGEPKTGRGRASRERIEERAAELLAEQGIAATSVDEVLAAAGAGKGQFYHYCRGRDELAAAAVGHRCAQVVAGLAQALGGVSSLAGLEQALAGFVAG